MALSRLSQQILCATHGSPPAAFWMRARIDAGSLTYIFVVVVVVVVVVVLSVDWS